MVETEFIRVNRTRLAAALEVNKAHISRIFNPKEPDWPSLFLAGRIARELGITIDRLWEHLKEIGKSDPRA